MAKKMFAAVLVLIFLGTGLAKSYPFKPRPFPPTCPARDMLCW